MPIIPFSEQEQLNKWQKLDSPINTGAQRSFPTPSLLRNYETGWPLLQISNFVPSDEFYLPPRYLPEFWWTVSKSQEKKEDAPVRYIRIESNEYVNESACLSVPLFSLACLLKQVYEQNGFPSQNGPLKQAENNLRVGTPSQRLASDVFCIKTLRYFLQKGFIFEIKSENIKIGSDFEAYLTIKTAHVEFNDILQFPILNSIDISNTIYKIMRRVFSLTTSISNADDKKTFLLKDVEVKEQFAIVYENQVYVDLGILFDIFCDKEEKQIILSYFEKIFNVNEFNIQKKFNPSFKPDYKHKIAEEGGKHTITDLEGKPKPDESEYELLSLPHSPGSESSRYRSTSSDDIDSLSGSFDFPENTFSSEFPPSGLETSLPPLEVLDADGSNRHRARRSERQRSIRQADASSQPLSNYSINSMTSSIELNPFYQKNIRFIDKEAFGGSRPDQLQEFGIIYRSLNDAYESKKNNSTISLKRALHMLAQQLIPTKKILGKEVFSSPRYFNNRDKIFRADENQLVAWLEEYNDWKDKVVRSNFQGYTQSEKERFERVLTTFANPDYIDGMKLPSWAKPFKV